MNYNEELLKMRWARDGRKIFARHPTKQWSRRDPTELKGIVLHQSLEEHGSASGNARYHVGPNHISSDGLPGLSYTAFVEKDGYLWLANDIEDVTYSQGTSELPGDENYEYLAICFGGNFKGPGYEGTQQPNSAQMNTAQALWTWAANVFGFKNNQLFGHLDFGKPACPGYALMNFIDGVNATKNWRGFRLQHNLDTVTGRQEALRDLGHYEGVVDGEWGPLSKKALCEFQLAAGVVVDGVWGKKTESAVVDELQGARHRRIVEVHP